MSHQAHSVKMEYYLLNPTWHCVPQTRTAGARYRNYFPEPIKHSAFNKTKYKRYFLYLKAKGIFPLRNVKTPKYAENTELH